MKSISNCLINGKLRGVENAKRLSLVINGKLEKRHHHFINLNLIWIKQGEDELRVLENQIT